MEKRRLKLRLQQSWFYGDLFWLTNLEYRKHQEPPNQTLTVTVKPLLLTFVCASIWFNSTPIYQIMSSSKSRKMYKKKVKFIKTTKNLLKTHHDKTTKHVNTIIWLIIFFLIFDFSLFLYLKLIRKSELN